MSAQPAGEAALVVVGGGPAGVSAALHARELGAQVILLEADLVGGTSLNRGPAPVRTLARAARLARDWGSWSTFGLEGPPPVANLPAMLANSERVARYAHDKKHIAEHLRQQQINLLEGLGSVRFADPHTLVAPGGRSWQGERIILAVGGRAARLPIPGDELAMTYDDIPSLRTLPREVAIIGGADTGCQIASILADLGTTVSIFEAGATLLRGADISISKQLARVFTTRGIAVHTGALAQALERSGERIVIHFDSEGSPHQSVVDAVFVAVGWPANVESLDLDAAGVQTRGGEIPVDGYLSTNVPHIFAAGDVNGHSKLVQTARYEGRIAADNAIGGSSRQVSYEVVPSGSFTDPEYGRVGLTEAQAASDHDSVVGIAWYDDLLRPVADARTDGFCKLIADRDQRTILGAHVLGEYSAEIVQVVAVAMDAGMTVERIAELQFAFPTFTEAVSMAAQKICRSIGVGRFPRVWSDLESEDRD